MDKRKCIPLLPIELKRMKKGMTIKNSKPDKHGRFWGRKHDIVQAPITKNIKRDKKNKK